MPGSEPMETYSAAKPGRRGAFSVHSTGRSSFLPVSGRSEAPRTPEPAAGRSGLVGRDAGRGRGSRGLCACFAWVRGNCRPDAPEALRPPHSWDEASSNGLRRLASGNGFPGGKRWAPGEPWVRVPLCSRGRLPLADARRLSTEPGHVESVRPGCGALGDALLDEQLGVAPPSRTRPRGATLRADRLPREPPSGRSPVAVRTSFARAASGRRGCGTLAGRSCPARVSVSASCVRALSFRRLLSRAPGRHPCDSTPSAGSRRLDVAHVCADVAGAEERELAERLVDLGDGGGPEAVARVDIDSNYSCLVGGQDPPAEDGHEGPAAVTRLLSLRTPLDEGRDLVGGPGVPGVESLGRRRPPGEARPHGGVDAGTDAVLVRMVVVRDDGGGATAEPSGRLEEAVSGEAGEDAERRVGDGEGDREGGGHALGEQERSRRAPAGRRRESGEPKVALKPLGAVGVG